MEDLLQENNGSLANVQDKVIQEELVLLDFSEFKSTSLYNDSNFELVSENGKDSVYKVTNSSINNIKLCNVGSEESCCVLDDTIPLKGKRVENGLTYILVNTELLQKTPKEPKQSANSGTKDKNYDMLHTNTCIEFTTSV